MENRFSLKTNKVKHEENDIRKQVMIIKKEEEGKGILAKIPQPSRFQMNRLLNAHFPESDANPTITNENRERKLNDPINAISNVIMTSAVLQPTVTRPNGRFHPACVHSMDAMSAAIGKPQKSRKVYTIAGSKAAMADVGRSCSRKSKPRERKMRSVKMLAVGSSDEPCCAYYKAADMYQSRMA